MTSTKRRRLCRLLATRVRSARTFKRVKEVAIYGVVDEDAAPHCRNKLQTI